MKKPISIFVMAILAMIVFNQNGNAQNCVFCNLNTVGDSSSAIGAENISTGINSFASGYQNEATGDNSIALVKKAIASGHRSVAMGLSSHAFGRSSLALGPYTETSVTALVSVAMGSSVTAGAERSMSIGFGLPDSPIIDTIEYSLMMGFNSDIPTLFMGPSNGAGTVGKIGIGTTAPSELLEVNGNMKVNEFTTLNHLTVENAIVNNNLSLNNKNITGINGLIGNDGLRLRGLTGGASDIMIDPAGNVGIGTETPAAKLQVNGNIFIDNQFSGLILKSPDGQCWKGTIDDSGSFAFESINCNLITGEDKTPVAPQALARIFPNPAGNKLTIELPSDIQQSFVSFYNEQGILMLQKEISGGNNIISLKKLPIGILVVKVFNGSGELISVEKVFHR